MMISVSDARSVTDRIGIALSLQNQRTAVGLEVQQVVCGGVGGQAQRRKAVHDEVHPQHLHRRQGALLCRRGARAKVTCWQVVLGLKVTVDMNFLQQQQAAACLT